MRQSIIIAGVQWGEFVAADGKNVTWAKCLVLEDNSGNTSRGYIADWYKLRPELVNKIQDMPGTYDVELGTVRDYKSGMRGFKVMELDAPASMLRTTR